MFFDNPPVSGFWYMKGLIGPGELENAIVAFCESFSMLSNIKNLGASLPDQNEIA